MTNMAGQFHDSRLIFTSLGVATREQGTISGHLVIQQQNGVMQVKYEGTDEWLTVDLTVYCSRSHDELTTLDGFADMIGRLQNDQQGGRKK